MPASPRAWAQPFLEQAGEDLKAAWLVRPNQSPSTFCMLLQMVFEKLGKAAYSRAGSRPPQNHAVASLLFAMLLRHRIGRTLMDSNPQVRQFIAELELAHPAGAKGRWPQLEYPWEDLASGQIFYPARDFPLGRRVRDPKDRIAQECLKFASALERDLMTILP